MQAQVGQAAQAAWVMTRVHAVMRLIEAAWAMRLVAIAFGQHPFVAKQCCLTETGLFYLRPDGEMLLFFDGGLGSTHPQHLSWVNLTPSLLGIVRRVAAAVCALPPLNSIEPGIVYIGGGVDLNTRTLLGDLFRIQIVVLPSGVTATCMLVHRNLPLRFFHSLSRGPRGTLTATGGLDGRHNRPAIDWTYSEVTGRVTFRSGLRESPYQAPYVINGPLGLPAWVDVTDFSEFYPGE
eukprot:TRINITY_DN3248_c0_g1_i5.p1 TRINITY_DN3248_c0_g1~~TRINITY_DN3248_c0_g1_i5.p1  ORF type:complete len:263 (+),score=44.43 TRINITY_DN3248_c0_g1_i5:83-790(+)